MSKGFEQHKNERKKPKHTLKEKRQLKREKKEKSHASPIDVVENI